MGQCLALMHCLGSPILQNLLVLAIALLHILAWPTAQELPREFPSVIITLVSSVKHP